MGRKFTALSNDDIGTINSALQRGYEIRITTCQTGIKILGNKPTVLNRSRETSEVLQEKMAR